MIGMTEVIRDERTMVVEDRSYRLAYLVMSYALLVDVLYRSIARREAPWELLAIVVLGGLASTCYQARHKILNARLAGILALTFGLAALIAALIAAWGS